MRVEGEFRPSIRKPSADNTRLSLPARANGQKGFYTMSGYKDSMYWASDEEIAAYRERQQRAAQPANEPEPIYKSYSYCRRGERVYVDIRQEQSQPVKLDGFSI